MFFFVFCSFRLLKTKSNGNKYFCSGFSKCSAFVLEDRFFYQFDATKYEISSASLRGKQRAKKFECNTVTRVSLAVSFLSKKRIASPRTGGMRRYPWKTSKLHLERLKLFSSVTLDEYLARSCWNPMSFRQDQFFDCLLQTRNYIPTRVLYPTLIFPLCACVFSSRQHLPRLCLVSFSFSPSASP